MTPQLTKCYNHKLLTNHLKHQVLSLAMPIWLVYILFYDASFVRHKIIYIFDI
jgi:hypothetical protein